MNKNELQRTLNDDGTVNVVEVTTLPRFEGHAYYSRTLSDDLMEQIKSQCDIWCSRSREGFDILNTIDDWEPEFNDLQKDLDSFQAYLDEKYGKNEMIAFALGAYIHSLVSFSISKSEDNRCRWDSGTCGFIGVPNNCVDCINKIANDMTDAWNGSVYIMEIYDNLNQNHLEDVVYSYEGQKAIDAFKQRALNLGVDFNKIEIEC